MKKLILIAVFVIANLGVNPIKLEEIIVNQIIECYETN